jgi:LPXTG-motif cell wall-anchored protein
MPYMLAPGARLEIGPGGKMYESMGDCACRPSRTGLGALDKSGNVIGTSSLKTRSVALSPVLAAQLQTSQSASPGFFSGSLGPTLLIGGAAAAVGAFLLLRRKRRRR